MMADLLLVIPLQGMDGGSGEKGVVGIDGRQGFPGDDVRHIHCRAWMKR